MVPLHVPVSLEEHGLEVLQPVRVSLCLPILFLLDMFVIILNLLMNSQPCPPLSKPSNGIVAKGFFKIHSLTFCDFMDDCTSAIPLFIFIDSKFVRLKCTPYSYLVHGMWHFRQTCHIAIRRLAATTPVQVNALHSNFSHL